MLDEYLKYTKGELTPHAREDLFKKMLEEKDNPETQRAKEAETAFLCSTLLSEADDEKIALEAFENFSRRKNKGQIRRLTRGTLRYAAVGLAAFTAGASAIWLTDKPVKEPLTYNEIEVPVGQRSKLTLSDGSVVWLHSNSKLSYPSRFQGDERNVSLVGEAYFEVNADKTKPFVVKLPRQEVRVLGTEFNVSAYRGDRTSIALIKGSVEVNDPKNASSVMMTPGHKLTFVDNTMSVDSILNTDFLLWKRGIYAFEGSTFEEIGRQLENYYGMRTVFLNARFKSYRFTAKFRQEDGIDNIMNLLKESKPFNFKKNDLKREIYIY